MFDLPQGQVLREAPRELKGKHGPKGWGVDKRLRRAATTQYLMAHMNESIDLWCNEVGGLPRLHGKREARRERARALGRQGPRDGVEAHRRVRRGGALRGISGEALDVFLTTEDAKAVAAFRKAAPENWNVVVYEAAVSSDKVLYGRHGGGPGAEPQAGLPLAGRARAGHAGRRLRHHVRLQLVAAHGGAGLGRDLRVDVTPAAGAASGVAPRRWRPTRT